MCWFKRKDNNQEKAMEILRCYVRQDSPIINMQLRSGIANQQEVALLDSLFSHNLLPQYLYRWLPAQYVSIDNNMLIDNAYLSCSMSVDQYFYHITEDDAALYIIETYNGLESIDIRNMVPEANNEQEFLLPHGVRLNVIVDKLYPKSEFGQFLRDIQCSDIRVDDLAHYYQSIRLIRATLL